MKRSDDKIRSVGASLLLEYALGKRGISDFCYGYGDRGKPFLSGRDDICFNLSHSGNRVMCAISSSPVGCDVERVTEVSDALEKKVLTALEREICMSSDDRRRAFFRFWTAKESFVKTVGDGMAIPLLETEVLLGESFGRVGGYFVKEYFLDDGYCYACCSEECKFPSEPSILGVQEILKEA
jgi:4'-phosphopantetheinyl transferase